MDQITLAARATEILLGLSLTVQTLEFLRLREPLSNDGVWSYVIQRGDLAHSRRAQSLLGLLARDDVHLAHLVLRLMAAVSLFLGSSLSVSAFLFLSTLAILIRWRGAFNGGSDFMTVMVLTGMLIANAVGALTDAETGWRAGLWYVAIHTISSYFISGGVKLLNPEWRSGKALPIFLDGGVYGPLAPHSLFRKRSIAMLCSWAFILWECSVPLALFDFRIALFTCSAAVIFHFLVFWFFGLNRFFFAWLAALPSILFASTQL